MLINPRSISEVTTDHVSVLPATLFRLQRLTGQNWLGIIAVWIERRRQRRLSQRRSRQVGVPALSLWLCSLPFLPRQLLAVPSWCRGGCPSFLGRRGWLVRHSPPLCGRPVPRNWDQPLACSFHPSGLGESQR